MDALIEFRQRNIGFTENGVDRNPTDGEIFSLQHCPICIQNSITNWHQVGCPLTGIRFPIKKDQP